MGSDCHGVQKAKRFTKRHTDSPNPYIKLLCKLYKFLASRTTSGFNRTVYKRLLKSRQNRAPISLSRISTVMRRKTVWQDAAKTQPPVAVIVGDVLDDIRMLKLQKLSVCALRFSRGARQRIEGAGGQCLTFDQLALVAPTGKNTFLLRGRKAGEERFKHFGAGGTPGSHAKPYVSSRGAETMTGRHQGKRKRASFKHI